MEAQHNADRDPSIENLKDRFLGVIEMFKVHTLYPLMSFLVKHDDPRRVQEDIFALYNMEGLGKTMEVHSEKFKEKIPLILGETAKEVVYHSLLRKEQRSGALRVQYVPARAGRPSVVLLRSSEEKVPPVAFDGGDLRRILAGLERFAIEDLPELKVLAENRLVLQNVEAKNKQFIADYIDQMFVFHVESMVMKSLLTKEHVEPSAQQKILRHKGPAVAAIAVIAIAIIAAVAAAMQPNDQTEKPAKIEQDAGSPLILPMKPSK